MAQAVEVDRDIVRSLAARRRARAALDRLEEALERWSGGEANPEELKQWARTIPGD